MTTITATGTNHAVARQGRHRLQRSGVEGFIFGCVRQQSLDALLLCVLHSQHLADAPCLRLTACTSARTTAWTDGRLTACDAERSISSITANTTAATTTDRCTCTSKSTDIQLCCLVCICATIRSTIPTAV